MQFAVYYLWENLKVLPLINTYARKTSYTGYSQS